MATYYEDLYNKFCNLGSREAFIKFDRQGNFKPLIEKDTDAKLIADMWLKLDLIKLNILKINHS